MEEQETNKSSSLHDPDFEEKGETWHRVSQAELSDLIRDLQCCRNFLNTHYSHSI